jgi:hypothetical protein
LAQSVRESEAREASLATRQEGHTPCAVPSSDALRASGEEQEVGLVDDGDALAVDPSAQDRFLPLQRDQRVVANLLNRHGAGEGGGGYPKGAQIRPILSPVRTGVDADDRVRTWIGTDDEVVPPLAAGEQVVARVALKDVSTPAAA